jgi:hypothetical protein
MEMKIEIKIEIKIKVHLIASRTFAKGLPEFQTIPAIS